jgi:Carboxypeptidase regulatory-like domain
LNWKAAILVCGLSSLASWSATPAFAADNAGKISGVVVDSAGTPQMGASVVISSEKLSALVPLDLLTNDRGRFSSQVLPVGDYTLKATLAGFLPAMEQHIRVTDQRTTLVQIVLGSVFSSFDQLRRHPDQKISADDWTWVLRTSPDNRSVLRWTDGPLVSDAEMSGVESTSQTQRDRVQMELTSGSDHPGSIGAIGDSPGTAVVYDLGLGSTARLLMAGQFSYSSEASGGGFAAEWLPSGEAGTGPRMVLEARESQLGPTGPIFRGLRISDSDQLALGDRVSVRYGAEFLAAGLAGTTQALRPHGELAVRLFPTWLASVIVASRSPEEEVGSQSPLQSALDSLDDFPILMIRDGRPVLENGWHEELSIDHGLGKDSDISAAVFHDRSTHTALIGRGNNGSPEFLQDSLSDVFAYDGGTSGSTGARVAYRQRLTDTLNATLIYAYAGTLAPIEDSDIAILRNELSTQYRHSVAARLTAELPRLGTKVSTSYKWINGDSASRVDSYGESLYHIDPYLSMEVRQPLPRVFPCHMEIMANVGNLLAQGYIPLATKDGDVILVPSYRYFTGGLSLQF